MSSVQPSPHVATLRFVRLHELRLDHKFWSNPRTATGLGDEHISELAADIKLRGILDPITVQKVTSNGDSIDLVLDGQRRVIAGREVLDKNAEIPVIDRTVEPIELTQEIADSLLLDALAAGQKREGLSSYELSEVADKLRGRQRTLLEIGRAIGKSESWVSKILKARSAATPKLMLQWKKGEITEEQFKELAAVAPAQQSQAVEEVVTARKEGDKAAARAASKEHVAKAKSGSTNGVNGHTKPDAGAAAPALRAVTGPQQDLFEKTPKPEPKKSTPSKAVLEDVIGMADKRPPTHDYVKGVIDGVKFALGELEMSKFGAAWKSYLARIDGSGKPKKKAPKKERTARKAKARKSAKKSGKKARR